LANREAVSKLQLLEQAQPILKLVPESAPNVGTSGAGFRKSQCPVLNKWWDRFLLQFFVLQRIAETSIKLSE
jgi:hypothetical protein